MKLKREKLGSIILRVCCLLRAKSQELNQRFLVAEGKSDVGFRVDFAVEKE